ncbi:unnamed protein product [Trichobilharzia szidati]|nr:unnamed protein product [Trichobilharzia szidati]
MDFLLNLESHQPQLYVTASIFNNSKDTNLLLHSSPARHQQTTGVANSQDVDCSYPDDYISIHEFSTKSNTNLYPKYNLTLSSDWSEFLKIYLENYVSSAFLFDITLTPGFKSHGQIKSTMHLSNCYESYKICDFQIIGQYQCKEDCVHDVKQYKFLNNNYTSIKQAIPNKEDCEKICWAIKQPHTYRNGGLYICGKRYKVLYTDFNEALMATEQSGINKMDPSTFTATRLKRYNEEDVDTKGNLKFMLLIGFHKYNQEQEKCNEAIVDTMGLLKRKLTCYNVY